MSTRSRLTERGRGAELADEMRAVLRVFMSRRSRLCGECGAPILAWEDIARVGADVLHRDCQPPADAGERTG